MGSRRGAPQTVPAVPCEFPGHGTGSGPLTAEPADSLGERAGLGINRWGVQVSELEGGPCGGQGPAEWPSRTRRGPHQRGNQEGSHWHPSPQPAWETSKHTGVRQTTGATCPSSREQTGHCFGSAELILKARSKKIKLGRPWGSRGKESALWCGGRTFDPWSGN